MSQHPIGYQRRPNEVGLIRLGWDPCDNDSGPGELVTALRALDVHAASTSTNFFETAPPPGVMYLIINPPSGENRPKPSLRVEAHQ